MTTDRIEPSSIWFSAVTRSCHDNIVTFNHRPFPGYRHSGLGTVKITDQYLYRYT
ncbi:MAG: hypothetical protein K6A62_02585 [Bacteroidales bacterium]|nr:hypothetical protein [Bacteroidales bacterium]